MAEKPHSYFDEDPQCQIIGPQIGPVFDPCGVKITIALPHLPDLNELGCVLRSKYDAREHKSSTTPGNETFRNFVFEFTGLMPGIEYFYSFQDADGNLLDLQSLSGEDCRFSAPSFSNPEDKFILFSCNNIFYSGGPKTKRYRMWSRLRHEIAKDKNIRLIVQGGDQVYNDDIEVACLTALRKNPQDLDTVRKMLIKNYQHFYSHPVIRAVLAQTPSVAMWDDHDITDGWGGRPESFDKNSDLKPEWEAYFKCAREAFQAYQGSKNPIHRPYDGAETVVLDFGKNRLVMMDLRSEKNIKNDEEPLLSKEHAGAIFRVIDQTPDNMRTCFVLSPVVPVRISPEKEEALGMAASILYGIRSYAEGKLKGHMEKSWLWRTVFHLSNVGGIADLWDDLKDGLSSKENIPFLRMLISSMVGIQSRSGIRTVILSGDIHTGGISEIFAYDKDNRLHVIPQIVSSPIGYEPMKAVVQSQTTEGRDFEIAPSQGKVGGIRARNIAYRSDRNFAIVCPEKLGERAGVQFFFEGLKLPITSSAYFSDLPVSGAEEDTEMVDGVMGFGA